MGMSRLLNEHQLASEPFHVTEELLPALLGKLVKLVQETEIKTDRDMDNTINKAATEVLQEATNTKSEVEDNSSKKQRNTHTKYKNRFYVGDLVRACNLNPTLKTI